MNSKKWVPALSTIGGWLLGSMIALAILFGLSKLFCHKPVPVHVSPVDTLTQHDTTVITHHDTMVHVVVNRDSLIALEKKVQSLTDEKESWMLEALDLGQQMVVIDSQWAARFDSVAGMVAVQYRRGQIDVVQFQRPKYVRTSSVKSWRNTWTIRAKPGGGVSFVQRRLPFDLGVEAAVDAWSDFNAAKPGCLVSACVTMRTGAALSGRAGVGWLTGSGPVLVARVSLGMEF